MLDSYIIEELKRRERERLQRERQRPTLEIPVAREEREEDEEEDRRSDRRKERDPVEPGRPVVQIDLSAL